MEMCLGTVQFGLDYGIKGQKKPKFEDSIACLDYATQNGIRAIDTARAYGNAESIVGEFLKKKTVERDKLCISTKMKPNLLDDYEEKEYVEVIERELQSQLDILHTDYVDVYLYHSSRYAFDEKKLAAIRKVKEKGLARKVGVSIYETEEARACFDSKYVDFIQMPYSIFDHRMRNGGIFEAGIKAGCEMATRSAFIQGLITMDEWQVPTYLESAKPIIKKIKTICDEQNLSRVHLALQYVSMIKDISFLVFGIDTLEQLKEDIELFNRPISQGVLEEIGRGFDDIDARIVMPSLWKK